MNLYHDIMQVFPFKKSYVVEIFAGVSEVDEGTKSLDDKLRIDYIGQHLLYVEKAIR